MRASRSYPAVLTAIFAIALGLSESASAVGSITSFVASPSVVCTVEMIDGELGIMALLRGKPGWTSSRKATEGGQSYAAGRDGFTAHLSYGDVFVNLTVDRAAHTVRIGTAPAVAFPEGSNALLLDSVDQPGGPLLTKALRIDATGLTISPADPRFADLPSILERSAELVSFLQ